jgi:hypothetical protein
MMIATLISFFRNYSINKYDRLLQKKLTKRYGFRHYYTAHQVRATVYQCCFNTKYLPLGYLIYLSPSELRDVMMSEFPELNIVIYKKQFDQYLQHFTVYPKKQSTHDYKLPMVQ